MPQTPPKRFHCVVDATVAGDRDDLPHPLVQVRFFLVFVFPHLLCDRDKLLSLVSSVLPEVMKP